MMMTLFYPEPGDHEWKWTDGRATCAACGMNGEDYAIDSHRVCPGPPKVQARYLPCLRCTRELSPYLDAYHGSDPVARELCIQCRPRSEGGFGRNVPPLPPLLGEIP